MNVLFEEDGAFKAGSVFTDNVASLQVEMASGKRTKVKAAHVLLRFSDVSPTALMERAEAESRELETDFLWEMCGEEEFGFDTFAKDYFGHPPTSAEAAAVLLALHSAPMYFHRKGRGRFRKAPPDILKAALAGQEKKRLQAETQERMTRELGAGTLPGEFAPLLRQILYKPDRNTLEVKALEAACAATGLGPAQLLARCGAIPSSHEYHFERFLFEFFPQGTDFGTVALPALPTDLPLADVAAFSIDDATTTEIDDAFSVTPLAEGGWRIGIHIAAPALGFRPGAALDVLARQRLSTVYMPGRKITMLPDEVVAGFTLAAGKTCPALSLYLTVSPDLVITARDSRVEQVPILANLRHHDIEPLFNEHTVLEEGGEDFSYKAELTLLWRLAEVLEAGRGKPAANQNLVDFNYYVDWNEPEGRISISQRRRGSPLDKLVAELMIVANSTWGRLLADAKVAAIYRAQAAGKVRMTTAALPHEGLGVDCYAWSSSPLRRYVDLLNQWQLLSHLQGEEAPFGARSEALHAVIRDFELTYAAYNEFQRNMERYWCLRWLRQEGVSHPIAKVVRENLVRLEDVPFIFKLPSLPPCHPGTRVRLVVEDMDLLEVSVRCRYLETVTQEAVESLDSDLQEE